MAVIQAKGLRKTYKSTVRSSMGSTWMWPRAAFSA